MPTPYEEISNERSNREAVKTDANLAQDSLQLGGIDAEEYALKTYVQEVDRENSKRDQKYTDDKIKQLSEDLKGYTDAAIGNQDFTDFTRKKDLETVQEQLQNTINDTKTNLEEIINQTKTELQEGCEESCKTNLETAKNYTDEKYNELFQSVSDGKSKIAEAITDKGVNTSASDSYDKMADNISQIQTGLDTSDATATSSTILRNYTAYAKGQKITGIYEPLTLPNVPTYGINTSDATATPSDIKIGKTAYVNGEKITGTLQTYYVVDPGDSGQDIVGEKLPEIYDIADADYESNYIGNLYNTFDSEEYENTITNIIASDLYFSDKGPIYIARITKEKNSPDDTFICINEIANNSIVTQGTYNPDDPEHPIIKKWRYSCADLGISNDAYFRSIRIGGEGNVLMIIEEHLAAAREDLGDSTIYHSFYAHFYPIDIEDGIIGNAYKDEYLHSHYELLLEHFPQDYDSCLVSTAKSKISNTFAVSIKGDLIKDNYSASTQLIKVTHGSSYGVSATSYDIEPYYYHELEFEASDTLLNCNYIRVYNPATFFQPESEGYASRGTYVFIDTNSSKSPITKVVPHNNEITFISDDGKYMYAISSGGDIGLGKVNIDYDAYTVSYDVIQASLMSTVIPYFINASANWIRRTFFKFSTNNRFLLCGVWDNGWQLYEVKIDIKEDSVEIVKWKILTYAFSKEEQIENTRIFSDNNYSNYFFFENKSDNSGLYLTRRNINITNTILAIDYKGQRFFSPRANNDVDIDMSKITEKEE